MGWNPGASTLMEYTPGTRDGNVNRPEELVRVSRATLVSTLVAVTFTAVTMAPLASFTSPTMPPKVWAPIRHTNSATRIEVAVHRCIVVLPQKTYFNANCICRMLAVVEVIRP